VPDQLAEALLRYSDGQPGESPFMTAIDGLAVMRSDHPKPPTHMISRPAMCIVAQGTKWATFGCNRLEYRAGQALVIGVETPRSAGWSRQARTSPVLFSRSNWTSRSCGASRRDWMCRRGERGARPRRLRDRLSGPLADCALRLVRLLDTPKAIATLYPSSCARFAIGFWTGPHGGDVARMALSNSPSQRVIAPCTACDPIQRNGSDR